MELNFIFISMRILRGKMLRLKHASLGCLVQQWQHEDTEKIILCTNMSTVLRYVQISQGNFADTYGSVRNYMSGTQGVSHN